MMKNAAVLILCFWLGFQVHGQQTVGLFNLDSDATPGFTLFAPMNDTGVYLVDNCGRLVNSWGGSRMPGVSVYLLENGDLLRCLQDTSLHFNAGGYGGWLEIQDWDGNLLWEYDFGSATDFQHHDIEPLPNGNLLVLSWEYHSKAEAVSLGRDPAHTYFRGIWSEKLTELRPIYPDSAEVVWEWRIWDHLIQDFSATSPNYGVVPLHPERVDLNWEVLNGGSPDWVHINGVDYDPVNDQILVSVLHFDELWVIDHSTTTAEAASTSGGNQGKGGDLLYRWGNPITYKKGTLADQRLFGQHDARWIPQGQPHAGNISVFNNGAGRPQGNISSVDIIAPPVDANGAYTLSGSTYGPDSAFWSYKAPVPTDFYSSFISGAHSFPNGHWLVTEGDEGIFFEIDSMGNEVWRYVNPVGGNGPITQGNLTNGNIVFRAHKYLPAYGAFVGRSLVSGNQIEINPLPLPGNCPPIVGLESEKPAIQIYPNPTRDQLVISRENTLASPYALYDLQGRIVGEGIFEGHELRISMVHLLPGIYVLSLGEERFKVIRAAE